MASLRLLHKVGQLGSLSDERLTQPLVYYSMRVKESIMSRSKITFLALFLCVLLAPQIQAQTDADSSANKDTGELKIVVTSLEVNDKALKLSYDIKNDSGDDAWIRVDKIEVVLSPRRSAFDMHIDVSIAEDGHTLIIGKRILPRPINSTAYALEGKYVRLRSGERQNESIFITMPFSKYSIEKEHMTQQERGLKHATRLAIELGYYTGNLPERVFKKLKPSENASPESSILPSTFNSWQERVISRDEEVWIAQEITGYPGFNETEQVLRKVVDNLRIPYKEKQYGLPYKESTKPPVKYKPPDLTSCTKIEIRYQPSMLEYFFPYASHQRLMSPEEIKYLQSETLIVDDIEDIKMIGDYFNRATAVDIGVVVRYRSYVDVVCYYEDKPSISFPIYDDDSIIDKKDELLCFVGFPSLTIRIPHIHAIDLRMQCAENLKNQWYRFRFYNLDEAMRQNDPSIRSKTVYPTPAEWCDEMLRPYPAPGGIATGKLNDKTYVCPSAGEGKCHYAMNPNCEPNSPPDMVLLFETKAGWNQHGGPELFTFDNHEPKGGCVLLNDGTVKFIRTKEDLHQLRWK